MTKLYSFLRRLARDERGQDMVEYVLLAGFIAVAAGALLPGISADISIIFSKMASIVGNAALQYPFDQRRASVSASQHYRPVFGRACISCGGSHYTLRNLLERTRCNRSTLKRPGITRTLTRLACCRRLLLPQSLPGQPQPLLAVCPQTEVLPFSMVVLL